MRQIGRTESGKTEGGQIQQEKDHKDEALHGHSNT